jgi:hypothetical protein
LIGDERIVDFRNTVDAKITLVVLSRYKWFGFNNFGNKDFRSSGFKILALKECPLSFGLNVWPEMTM